MDAEPQKTPEADPAKLAEQAKLAEKARLDELARLAKLVEEAKLIDENGLQFTLNKTDEFLKWYAERQRDGTPPPEKKEPVGGLGYVKRKDADVQPESDYPDWWDEWHALHAENTSKQQGGKAERGKAPAPPLGSTAADESIFIGQYVLRNFTGDSLGKVFNVYAAPADIDRKPKTYDKTLKTVGKLVGWYGHNGGYYETAQNLYKALNDGSYKGEWVIPPAELLDGHDPKGREIQPDNISAHLNAGNLHNRALKLKTGPDWSDWYWSCTELRNGYSSLMYAIRFRPDKRAHSNRNINKVGCRPVRFVPVKVPGG